MALRIEPHSEIIPGYRLLERLGGGGFGEVWKAQAPGGLLKAIKIVHGDLGSDPDGARRAEQELFALQRVQAVRHPYLLSIDRYDIVDDRLLIVTELADCNLWERFQDCRSRRQVGIPREDLLRYLQEAAEVLDLMNNQFQLLHLDVKPQNLFLVHDHVKVADFGLVQDLDMMKRAEMPVNAGATPVYGAPETFEGNLSPHCDQYSLAVVYQELLTGKRPFHASSIQQIIAQHLQSAPDLSALPPGDRAAVAKALSKRPEDRHRSCMAFVKVLASGGATSPVVVPAPAPPVTSGSNHQLPEGFASPETPATQMLFSRESDSNTGERIVPIPAIPEQVGDGVLFPALVIGIGAIGMEVVQRVKQSVVDRFGSMAKLPTLRLLSIDTDPQTTENACSPSAPCPLDGDEVLSVRLNRPGHYLKPRRHGRSIIEGWFDSQLLYRIKAGNPLTLGLRTLGRLAFCDHYRTLEQKLRTDLEAVIQPEAMETAEALTQLTLRSNRPRVYVVAGMGGGTGSGMFIDVAYAVRDRLKQLGVENPDVVGIFLLPPTAGPHCRPLAIANTFASLIELNHFSMRGVTYTACIDDKEMTLIDQDSPFSRFTMLPLRAANVQKTEMVGVTRACEFLVRDLTTPFGRASDECRAFAQSMPGATPDSSTIAGQTFGMKAISWPRRMLLERTSRHLCHRLVQEWIVPVNRNLREQVHAWVNDEWTANGFAPEAMCNTLQAIAERALGKKIDELLASVVEPLQPRSRWSRGSYDPATAFQALSQLVVAMGQVGEGTNGNRLPTGLEITFQDYSGSALGELAERLAMLARSLMEKPEFRVAGAEEAIVAIKELLESAANQFDPLRKNASALAEQELARVQAVLEEDVRRRNGAELADGLLTYGKARFQALLAETLHGLYSQLRDLMAAPFKEIAFCRQRLTDMLQRFAPGPAPETPSGSLLPAECKTIEDAVQLYLNAVDKEQIHGLDQMIQQMIEDQFTALSHACLTTGEVMVKLEVAILQQARKFMNQRVEEADVAEMFLARGDADYLRTQLVRIFSKAQSELDAPESPEDAFEILAVPSGRCTEEFLTIVQSSLPGSDPTLTSSPDDIVFYREQVCVPIKCLPHAGRPGRMAYDQFITQQIPTHSRIDIRQWYRPDMM